MASTHQAQIPPKHLSSQEKHAEIFPNLRSSLISIGQLCDDECFDRLDNVFSGIWDWCLDAIVDELGSFTLIGFYYVSLVWTIVVRASR